MPYKPKPSHHGKKPRPHDSRGKPVAEGRGAEYQPKGQAGQKKVQKQWQKPEAAAGNDQQFDKSRASSHAASRAISRASCGERGKLAGSQPSFVARTQTQKTESRKPATHKSAGWRDDRVAKSATATAAVKFSSEQRIVPPRATHQASQQAARPDIKPKTRQLVQPLAPHKNATAWREGKPAIVPAITVVKGGANHAAHNSKYHHLLYGLHAVREAWLNAARQCETLWLTPAAAETFAATLAEATEKGLSRPAPQIIERAILDTMLTGAVHQGIALAAAPLPLISLEALLARQPRLLLVLDQVTDPHNVGAVLRSAAAFGAEAVILTERHAPSTTGTLAKTASGALEHVPLIAVVNLARALEQIRNAGFWCIGLAEEGATSLSDQDLSGQTALVFGAEGDGLRRLTRERCDVLARLPTQGAVGSLNISNAAAIGLYEVRRQRG